MSTMAQILSNRLNSRKSTKPKMDESKAAVSQNAAKTAYLRVIDEKQNRSWRLLVSRMRRIFITIS